MKNRSTKGEGSRVRRFSVAAVWVGICSIIAAFTLSATPALAASGVPSIRYGSSNHIGVKCVQRSYNAWRSYGGPAKLRVDGVYGPATVRAVRYLQARTDARPVDGIVGPRTGHVILAGLYYWYTNRTIGYGLTLHTCYTHVPGHP